MSSSVLITGASRGIGLALVERFSERDWTVFATCRKPSEASKLNELSEQSERVHVLALDVSSDASVAAAFEALRGKTTHIDCIVNNAGQNARSNFEAFDASAFLQNLNVNTVGAARVTHAAIDPLRKSKRPRVAFISSQLGAFALQREGFGSLGYNVSKAALNMVARKLSFELAADEIATVAIHPGWVKSDMGGADADITPAQSAAGIVEIVENLELRRSGEFLRYDGTVHPW